MSYPRNEYPGERPYVCEGQHASNVMKNVGPLEVYICADPCCARVIARCTHQDESAKSICTWNEEQTILSCTFCGVDAT